MSAVPEAAAVRPRQGLMARACREARAALELWLLPLVVALLPYRAGIAFARAASRWPVYERSAEAGVAQWRRVASGGKDDDAAFVRAYRFAQLIDHADLFWSLTRSHAWIRSRIALPDLALDPAKPLVVVSFHFGQGLWLLDAFAARGRAPRFVAARLAREEADSALQFAYAQLRNRQVAKLAGVQPIYTGGARAAIGETLAAGGTVFALLDVPLAPGARRANASLFGRTVALPTGVLEGAASAAASVAVVAAHAAPDGARVVDALVFHDPRDATPEAIAVRLEASIRRSPGAWHFWMLWPELEAAGDR